MSVICFLYLKSTHQTNDNKHFLLFKLILLFFYLSHSKRFHFFSFIQLGKGGCTSIISFSLDDKDVCVVCVCVSNKVFITTNKLKSKYNCDVACLTQSQDIISQILFLFFCFLFYQIFRPFEFHINCKKLIIYQ